MSWKNLFLKTATSIIDVSEYYRVMLMCEECTEFYFFMFMCSFFDTFLN